MKSRSVSLTGAHVDECEGSIADGVRRGREPSTGEVRPFPAENVPSVAGGAARIRTTGKTKRPAIQSSRRWGAGRRPRGPPEAEPGESPFQQVAGLMRRRWVSLG